MRWLCSVAASFLLAFSETSAHAQPSSERIALVIGNAAYQSPGWALRNPANDARLIGSRLTALGFSVDLVVNADKTGMDRSFARFAQRLRAGGPEAVGFFYFAGHGVEHDGANLLLPIDTRASSVDELRYHAPPMQFVLTDMARIGNPVNFIVLDACRNLPLSTGTRNVQAGGLAPFGDSPPDNVLIAYTTRPGETAPDNPEYSNSVFTRTLANALNEYARQPAVLMFNMVQARVYQETGQSQRPVYQSGLLQRPDWPFALPSIGSLVSVQPPGPPAVVPTTPPQTTVGRQTTAERTEPSAPVTRPNPAEPQSPAKDSPQASDPARQCQTWTDFSGRKPSRPRIVCRTDNSWRSRNGVIEVDPDIYR